MRAGTLIKRLGLKPHPEGGHYRETFRSAEEVITRRGARGALTTIYFLLMKGEVSLFHRVLSDEVWHYCQGAPLELIRVGPDFRDRESIALGPLRGRTKPAAVIPAGHWQAARPRTGGTRGDYTLVCCTVGPGFDFQDFTLLRDDKAAAARLLARFPKLSRWV